MTFVMSQGFSETYFLYLFSLDFVLILAFMLFLLNMYLDTLLYGYSPDIDGLYPLDIDDSFYNSSFVTSHDDDLSSRSITWYVRFCHIENDRMTRLARASILDLLTKVHSLMYEPSLVDKVTRNLFVETKKGFFQFIGPLWYLWINECYSTSWCLLFITSVNNYTRFRFVYLISHQSEAWIALDDFLS